MRPSGKLMSQSINFRGNHSGLSPYPTLILPFPIVPGKIHQIFVQCYQTFWHTSVRFEEIQQTLEHASIALGDASIMFEEIHQIFENASVVFVKFTRHLGAFLLYLKEFTKYLAASLSYLSKFPKYLVTLLLFL
jgi:hypothetical protein